MAIQNLTLIGSGPRQGRQLSERILGAAHQACAQGELDAARRLLRLAEAVFGNGNSVPSTARKHLMEGMIATHEMLWQLRQPHAGHDVEERAEAL